VTQVVRHPDVFEEAGEHDGRVRRYGAHADIVPLNDGERDLHGLGEHDHGHRVCFSSTTFGAGIRLGLEILADADRSGRVLVATVLNANPRVGTLVEVYERHGFRVLEQGTGWAVHMVRYPRPPRSE
jgi:hypothetical protein